MGILWKISRQFYLLGLIPAVPLFLIMAATYGKDREVTVPILLLCGLYFALGWLLLHNIPAWYARRVAAKVSKQKFKGFAPRWELTSARGDRYVGFDPVRRECLVVDGSRDEAVLKFDQLRSWEMEIADTGPAVLRLLTRCFDRPVIILSIDRHLADVWRAYLGVIFDLDS